MRPVLPLYLWRRQVEEKDKFNMNIKLKIKMFLVFFLCLATMPIFADSYQSPLSSNIRQLLRGVPRSSIVGIVFISDNDINTALSVSDDIEHVITELGYAVIGRNWLEFLPYFAESYEWRFRFNEAINDDFVQEIGTVIRADVALTGRIVETDSSRRLNLRTININTGEVIATVSCQL